MEYLETDLKEQEWYQRGDYKKMEIFRYIIENGKLVTVKAHIPKDYFLLEEYLRKKEDEIMKLKK